MEAQTIRVLVLVSRCVCWGTWQPCRSGSSLGLLGRRNAWSPLQKTNKTKICLYKSENNVIYHHVIKSQQQSIFSITILHFVVGKQYVFLHKAVFLTFSRWGSAGMCSGTGVFVSLHAAGAAPAAPAPSAGPHTAWRAAGVRARLTHSTTMTICSALPSSTSRTHTC